MLRKKNYWLPLILIATTASLSAAEVIAPPQGTHTLELTEQWRVGPDDQESYIWTPQTTSLAANKAGHVFVADSKAGAILELDQKGKMVRSIGRSGEGPGEFRNLTSFEILKDGTGVAFENLGGGGSVLNFFGPDGTYKDKKAVQNFQMILQSVQFSPAGDRLFASYVAVNPQNRTMNTHMDLLNGDLKVEKAFNSFPLPMPNPQKFRDPEYWVEYLSQTMQASAKGLNGFAAFDQDGNLYTATANKYEITKWGPDMKKMATFTHTYKPIPNTPEEIDAIVDPIKDMIASMPDENVKSIFTENVIRRGIQAAEFPPAKWPISGLTVLDDGLIVVLHDRDTVNKMDLRHIFNGEGRFLGSFKHPIVLGLMTRTTIFKGGKIFNLEEREDGECDLVCYGYRLVTVQNKGS